jgi:methyl-accepting chemotaxis protein
MRIRTKLQLLNLFVLAGFAMMVATTFFLIQRMRDLNALVRDGLSLKYEFLMFSERGKDMMTTGNLADSLEAWKAQKTKFAELYGKFAASRQMSFIKTAASDLEDFTFLWKMTQSQADDAAVNIEALVRAHEKEGFVSGLFMGYDQYGDAGFVTQYSMLRQISDNVTNTLMESLMKLVDAANEGVSASERSLTAWILILALSIAAISVAVFALFSYVLGSRITAITRSMNILKTGDLTSRFRVKGSDDLSSIVSAINGFVDDFSRIIQGVKTVSGDAARLKDEVTSATVESSAAVTETTANIASIGGKIRDLVESLEASDAAVRAITESINTLGPKIEEQTAFISQSTTSTEQINASIGNVAAIAERQEAAARELVAVTKNGGAMIEATNGMIREIVKDIKEIAGIVGIINGISAQTDLLSMNAAIEAAHAGGFGAGFAVVAGEIRTLADSTTANSKRIKEMIKGISSKTDSILKKSEETRAEFSEVDTEVDSTSKAMSEIAAIMHELSLGSKEIMKATQELAGIAGTVSEETRNMRSRTEEVLQGLKKIEEIGSVVRNGMTEIESATRDINTAMIHVSELQVRSGESIEKLNTEVAVFKTKETA